MKGKYITLQIRLACVKKPVTNKDIYRELEKTIQERMRIMQQFIKPATRLNTANRKEAMGTLA